MISICPLPSTMWIIACGLGELAGEVSGPRLPNSITDESVSRGRDVTPQQLARAQKELRYMKNAGAQRLKHDPAYNPQFEL